MSLWIKICGNTTLADTLLAAEAGADAVGFIFAPSPRRVTAEEAAAITPHLPAELEKIGVFVESGFEEIAATIERAALTGAQLHAGQSADQYHTLPARLRARFGPAFRILQVIHFGDAAAGQLQSVSADPALDGILIDSRTATAVGGTGVAYDWQTARALLFDGHSGKKLIAAGGLNPANVAEAIATLRPWGVDAVTGVEAAPGHKDPEKVQRFIDSARRSLS